MIGGGGNGLPSLSRGGPRGLPSGPSGGPGGGLDIFQELKE